MGMTHNIINDILLIHIHGIFDRIISKAYISAILKEATSIKSFIFQMNTIYVPTENDLAELMESIRHLKRIKNIAIIVYNKLQVAKAETLLKDSFSKDIGLRVFSDGHSAIEWMIRQNRAASPI